MMILIRIPLGKEENGRKKKTVRSSVLVCRGDICGVWGYCYYCCVGGGVGVGVGRGESHLIMLASYDLSWCLKSRLAAGLKNEGASHVNVGRRLA
jgi:hypothetical protein